jgi:thiol-disulfide isomerase/thioredoxin
MIRGGKVGLLLGAGIAATLLFAAGAFAEEKSMTPLSGGVPMIEGIKMIEVGSVAPDFSVKDAGGAVYDFREEKGKKPTLLVFWSIFCEPCRFEMPVVQKLHEKYTDRLSVVSVALDGEPLKNSILGFVKQEGYTFRVLVDELDEKEQFKVADPYGVAGTPTLFIVDRAGKVALAKVGRIKEEELEKTIQSVLK